jgi:hypothetical protein
MLRESLGGMYRSSATAKKRRRETIAKWDNDYVTHSNEEVSQILSNTTGSIQSKSLSDDAVLKLFNKTNCCILDALKRDVGLVQSFQAAMPKDSDEDEVEDDQDDAIVWAAEDEAPPPMKEEFV